MYSTEYFFFSMTSLCRLNVIQWPNLTAECRLYDFITYVHQYEHAITIIFDIYTTFMNIIAILYASTDIVVIE